MMTTKFKGVLLAELDGKWCLLAHCLQPTCALHLSVCGHAQTGADRYIRALGLIEDLLLRKDRIGKESDRKIPEKGGECELEWEEP